MRVRLKTIMAGPTISGGPGDELTVPDHIGKALVTGGFAEPIKDPIEVADPVEYETATAVDTPMRRPRGRPRKQ